MWCKRMLEEGAAAVIGPVDEPYVQAFPVPEIFFGLLVDGYLTLAECYAAEHALAVLAHGADRGPALPAVCKIVECLPSYQGAQVPGRRPRRLPKRFSI